MAIDSKAIRRAMMVAKDIAASVSNVPLMRDKGGQVDTIQGPERQQNLADFMEGTHPSIPKVLYHGTTHDVPEFTHEHAPHRGGLLAFFSESPKFSSKYAEGEKGNVLPVHVNIKNPFDFRDKFSHIDARNFYRDNGGINKWDADKIRDGLGLGPGKLTEDQFVRAVQKGHWPALEANEFVEWLRGLGHDGIVTKEGNAINYGVFEPTQIKSAVGNRGTFDPANPDITKAYGGDVEANDQEQWPHPVPKENMLKTHHAQRYGAGLPNNIVPENMFDRDENPGISHGTGPYLYALEHIGDLPHRLSYIDDVGGGVGYGIEAALDKTARNYDLRPERLNESLQRNYNFQKRENSFHGSYDDFVKKFEDAADRYAHAYRMIPVHTQLQELGRDAAIALGERDFYTARKNLNEIHRRLSGDNPEQEYWRPVKDLEASNSIAKNTARLERMRKAGGGDVEVKAPIIDPAKAIRRAKMVAKSIGGSNSESEQTEITPSHSETRTEAGKLQQPGAVRGGSGVLQASLQADPAAPLTDFPADIAIPATGQIIKAGPNPLIRQVASEYMRSIGRPYRPATAYAKVSPPRATRIAKAYEEMKHDPQDPLVKASYNQMLKETMAQYEAAKAAGFKAEFWNPETDEDPYGPSPRLAIEDVNKNHHMFVFPTRAGFGSDEEMAAELHQNPLLADSGERWNGQPVTYNDIFRAVHDYYGHAKEGVGFRADGEENAWRSHAAMYSPLARLAMTSETRGQNSWVNYGPHGEHNRKAKTEDTIFADQKNGILPAWVMHEGAEDFLHPDDVLETYKIYNRKHRADGGSLMDDDQPTTLKDPDLFDMSMLHETPKVAQFDLPRYMPARGVPERVSDITKSRKVANKLADVIQSGLDMGGARWYNAEPLRKEFLKYHGQDVGNRMFRKYMDMVAATSPRSEVSQNVRNASYYYQRLASGQPVPEVGEKNPQPYGHLAQRLHQLNAQRVAGAGWDPLNNPKPASFAENLTGNQAPVTVDTHAFRLPSILAEDPRFIETAYKPSKEAPPQNIRKMVESGELSLKDALKTPAYWNAAPKETEYAAMEQMYKKAAQKLGITPAAAQAAAWVGGGKLTGLASDESKPFMQFVQDRIYKTAREKNMDPQDVLQKFVKGEMSLYSDGGAVDAALNIAKKARKE